MVHPSHGVLVEATYANDEAKDIVFRGAPFPSATAPPPGRAALDGAFGLFFGPAGIDQIKDLECEAGRSCLGALADRLLWTVPELERTHESAYWSPPPVYRVDGSLLRSIETLSIPRPPRPVAGGKAYGVRLSAKAGLFGIHTEIGEFPTEDPCEAEAARLRDLLTGKYGQCTDYRYRAGSFARAPIGQCDSRGMPERKVTAFCHAKTEYVNDEARTKHHYVRLSYEVMLEAERKAIRSTWLKHGQVGLEDL